MASSSSFSTLLSLLLLLSAWSMAHAYSGSLRQIRLYLHETTAGPDATLLATVPSQPNTTFGMIGLLDDPLLDGPDPSKASLLGRFQGLVAFAGKVTPPGVQSVITFVFTAGRYSGSTIVLAGTVVSFDSTFERAIIGGTGKFRMARGWCVLKAVWNPTPISSVHEVNIFLTTRGTCSRWPPSPWMPENSLL